jgi:hypothetical protein
MLIRCLMYLINLTLLILFVAITDIQKNISRKIHRIKSEYIKFVETRPQYCCFQYCYAFLFKALQKQRKAIPFDLYTLKLKTK